MTIELQPGRQEVIAARITINFDDHTNVTGIGEPAIQIPTGSIVVGGYVSVRAAFNSGTSDDLTIGDTSSGNRYTPSFINLQSISTTELALRGDVSTSVENITAGYTSAGTAPTAGTYDLTVLYIRENRQGFTQG